MVVYLTRARHVSSPPPPGRAQRTQWTWCLPLAELALALPWLRVSERAVCLPHNTEGAPSANSSSGARPVPEPNTSARSRHSEGLGGGERGVEGHVGLKGGRLEMYKRLDLSDTCTSGALLVYSPLPFHVIQLLFFI